MIKFLLSLLVVGSLLAVDEDVSYTTKNYRSIGTQTLVQCTDEDFQKQNSEYKGSAYHSENEHSKIVKDVLEKIEILQKRNKTYAFYFDIVKKELSLKNRTKEEDRVLSRLAKICFQLYQRQQLEIVYLLSKKTEQENKSNNFNRLTRDLVSSNLFWYVPDVFHKSYAYLLCIKDANMKKNIKYNIAYNSSDFYLDLSDIVSYIYRDAFPDKGNSNECVFEDNRTNQNFLLYEIICESFKNIKKTFKELY